MKAEIKEKLATFLNGVAGKPVTWGRDDCTMQAYNWVKFTTGVEVLSLPYSSEAEAHAIIKEKGGLDVIWEEAMVPHFRMSSDAEYGDVGLIELTGGKLVGCIFGAGGAAVLRTDEGTRFLSPTAKYIHQIWSLDL